MGNVSQIVPSLHGFVAIAEKGTSLHTPQFATAAASDSGIKGMLDAAKTLAMTVVDLITNPEAITRAKKDFEQRI